MSDAIDQLPEPFRKRAAEIKDRVEYLKNRLAPAGQKSIDRVLLNLSKNFRHQPDLEPEDVLDGYRQALREVPQWALDQTYDAFLSGLVPNHTGQYIPACGEFARYANQLVHPNLKEIHMLRLEADQLISRAEDAAREKAIEAERNDPAVQSRINGMLENALKGQSVKNAIPERKPSKPEHLKFIEDAKQRPAQQSLIGYEGKRS